MERLKVQRGPPARLYAGNLHSSMERLKGIIALNYKGAFEVFTFQYGEIKRDFMK